MIKIDNELIIGYYFMGYELSQESKSFPNWFEFSYEKISCLCGYNDADLGVVKNKEEILKEIKELLK